MAWCAVEKAAWNCCTSKLLLCALLCIAPAIAAAQEEEDEEFRRGLIAMYASQDQAAETATRVDGAIAFDWGGRPPDPRLGEGAFLARWRGYLLSQGPGEYRLAAHAAGEVKITVEGKTILNAASDAPRWLDAAPIELTFGWHPLEIEFRSQGRPARLALFWSGPQFSWEPIGQRQFWHSPKDSPSDAFQRGEALAAALRCGACHADGNVQPLPAPALDRLAGNVSREWLLGWLSEKPQAGAQLDRRRMPHFDITEAQAAAITAYLLAESAPPEPTATAPAKKKDSKKEPPSAAAGERLFLTVGCLACHQTGELDEGGLFGGGDLTRIAEKRPTEFFERWLADPTAVNRNHRMPVFELTGDERTSLSLYLATLGEAPARAEFEASRDGALVREGRRLVDANRCGACHELPRGAMGGAAVKRLSEESDWSRACSAKPQAGKQPGYGLSADDAAAVREYWSGVSAVAKRAPATVEAQRVLRERNCMACHERDESPGLAAKLPQVIVAHPDLAPLLPAMTPPPLASVGDKLHEQALIDAIRRAGPVHRPWLAVRMPKFPLVDDELQSLVRHFIAHDRIPPHPAPTTEPPAPGAVVEAAGARLVTSDGFGCVSCHAVGTVQPEKAPLNARGPDLSLLSRRIRHEWFERWVRNPARIAPRMEMPAVQLPVRGVLDDNLDRQLAAVWRVLNTPGFEPPPPNPVRVLRRTGLPERNEWAVIGTDVIYDRGREHLKPLLIGLPNRHNFLFDLERSRTSAWYLGDAARQRTKGKTWFWETGGDLHSHLMGESAERSDVALAIDGRILEPLVVGQFPTEADAWRHVDGGVEWRHRLRFALGEDRPPVTLQVTQTITPLWPSKDSSENGFRRTVAALGIPAGARLMIRIPAQDSSKNESRIRLASPAAAKLDPSAMIGLAPRGDRGEASATLEYLTSRQPDTFPIEPPPLPPPSATPLQVAPGFDAVQLPLTEEIMPTALAWTPEGTLILASLKGRVWLAHDTDGDGLEDHAVPFSDDLAAPYGLASRSRPPDGISRRASSLLANGPKRAASTAIDVINKYGLLRLFDDDGDGRAERTETLASGWGHTTDYHDWAVGLPRDEQGNYYVALPCQQDDRSPAAAHLRGTILRLVPREPTADDPQQFSLEVVSAGHRFPMGIARRRDGELFVTDNQGNYNPFNELNHVLAGRRYGFINKLEQKEGFQPPLTPPAIDLPHPWTRSVNGICFLDTPSAARERLGRNAFGPFEGHLVGCEMNNKLLVRMTLHRVGDVLQGAVYPMTYSEPKAGAAFLGPLCAEVSPDGDLYVGSLLDSGWGGGNNIGSLVRMRPAPEALPAGIREVRAEPRGLVVEFTRPVDRLRAADPASYSLATYTRASTPAYGGPDVNRRSEPIQAIEVAEGNTAVVLRLKEWREGYVYELHLKNLVGEGEEFFPAEAHYTLRRSPQS